MYYQRAAVRVESAMYRSIYGDGNFFFSLFFFTGSVVGLVVWGWLEPVVGDVLFGTRRRR